MGYILGDARVPYGDHIETRDFDGRLEHDQPLVVLAQQARWNQCDKVVRLQYLWHEQEARHGVANLPAEPEASERPIGRAFEGSACWRHQNVIIIAKTLNSHG